VTHHASIEGYHLPHSIPDPDHRVARTRQGRIASRLRRLEEAVDRAGGTGYLCTPWRTPVAEEVPRMGPGEWVRTGSSGVWKMGLGEIHRLVGDCKVGFRTVRH
jgi:hypothetical protein